MRMTIEARGWLDDLVRRVLARHHLAEPERAGVHYELMSHLHAAAEAKATADGRPEVTVDDLQAALADAGGEAALERAFVQPLSRPPKPAAFGRRFLAWIVDMIIVWGGLWVVGGILFVVLAPMLGLAGMPLPGMMDRWEGPFDAFHGPHTPEGDFGPVHFGWLLAWVLFAAGVLLYFAGLEGTQGRTLGKRVMDLRVVRVDGAPVTCKDGFVRNLSKVWIGLLILDVLFWLLAFRETQQRVSDRIAGTMVVDER